MRVSSLFVNQPSRGYSICCMSRSEINSAESELMQFQLEPTEALPPQNEDQQQSQSQQQEAAHQGTEAAPSEG